MRNTKWISRLSVGVIGILLPLVILLSILQIYSFNKTFYLKQFEKNNIPDTTKISMEDLEKITEKIIGYLKNNEKDLNLQVSIDGNMEEVFGEREKEHMVDVKVLFQKGYNIRNGSFFLCLLALGILFKLSRVGIYKGLLAAGIGSVSFVVILFVLIQLDFNKYFTHFHEVFFTNDLWLLNPETDVLIQMLPLEFFISITTRVLRVFLGVMISIGVISLYGFKKFKNPTY